MKDSKLTIRIVKDKLFFLIIVIFSFFLVVPLGLILYYIAKNGIGVINIAFFTQLPKPMGMIGGGILNGLVGTAILITTASVIAIPFGISVGVYLAEYKHHKFSKYVRFCTEVLQGVPSIVLGIIAYAWVVLPFKSFSAIAGAVALSIMMLPVIIRSTEETMKMVPETIREASLSLGVPYSITILKVILPCAFNGILTGVLISVARIAGETAPLLFTAFGSPFLSFGLDRPIHSLPLLIYKYANSPFPQDNQFAWGVAVVLCGFVLMLNLIAKGVSKKWKVQF